VRKLQEIAGIGSSERSSPGSGGRWRCSAGIHEGRVGCRWPEAAVWVRGVETGGRVGAVTLERRDRRCGREGRKREGGLVVEVPRGAGRRRGAWPRPCPGRPRPGCDARGRRVAVRTTAHWRRPGGPRWQRERGGAGARGPAR
jgi:hypothetical protein